MTTKDDRALLEAAARAAGMETKWDQPRGSTHGYLRARYPNDGPAFPIWNPLLEDAEAFRLAVKLGISIVHRRTLVSDNLIAVAAARWADDYDDTETMYEGDPYAATRRAIVRAAASMAKEPAQDRER